MANLTPVAGLDPVFQLETSTLALGGPSGPMNFQAQALLNRTEYLREAIQGVIADLASSTDPAKGSALIQWLLNAPGAVSMGQDDKNRERVSVATFGVTGVGDDSVGMAAAIAWQTSRRITFNPVIGGGGGSAIVNCPILTIPDNWTVKVQGDLAPWCVLVSEGKSTIQGLDNGRDIVKGADTYMTYTADITFLDGRSQVITQNNNINAGLWLYERCTFEGSNDYSVQALNTSLTYGVTSTQLIMNDCRWIRCKRGLKTQCDHSYVIGGWMQPEGDFFDANTCFIHNTGLLSLNQVMTIPGGTFPAKSRWMDNYGAIRCEQTRFGGEGGGLPIVYHFAAPTRYLTGTAESIEMGISFDQCTLYGGGGARPDGGVIIIQGQLPPVVRITDCTGPITSPWIRNDPANGGIADITAYIANLKASFSGDDMYGELGYYFRGNKSKFNTSTVRWPAELDTYVYMDDGRLVKRESKIKTATTASIVSGTLTRMDLATTVYDPYLMKTLSSGANVIRVPPYARFAKFMGYVEIASHTANNLIYNTRVFYGGNAVEDAFVNYEFSTTGIIRMQITGGIPVVAGQDIDIRVIQSSGSNQTVSLASLIVEFT